MMEHQTEGARWGYWLARLKKPLLGAGLIAMAAAAFAFILFPLLSLFYRSSLDEFFESLGNPTVIKALKLSLMTASISTVIVVIFGTPVAYLLSHKSFPGKALLETTIDMTVVLPPAVAGLGLLLAFGRFGTFNELLDFLHLGRLPFTIPFSTLAVIMAQVFVSSPFYIRQAKVSLEEVDKDYEDAARTLGSSSLKSFIKVTMPLASAGLLSGAIMSWARALGEFGATIMFAGNMPGRTQTMPLAIYTANQSDQGAAIAISIVLVVVSFAVMAAVRILGRRMTYVGRNPR